MSRVQGKPLWEILRSLSEREFGPIADELKVHTDQFWAMMCARKVCHVNYSGRLQSSTGIHISRTFRHRQLSRLNISASLGHWHTNWGAHLSGKAVGDIAVQRTKTFALAEL